MWFRLFVLTLMFVPAPASATDRAELIAQKVFDRDDGRDSEARARMVLVDSSGRERERKLELKSKDFGELSRRYIRFSEPKAIEGTAFLSVENHERSDDQFLFLPALHRVRRIVSDQKDRSFVNTDFTFEDLERRKVEKNTYKILKEEKFLDRPCWVLESAAKNSSDTQYGRVVSWIAKESYLPLRVEFFNKKQTLVKVLEAHQVKQVDKIWTVLDSTMQDLENNHRTRLTFDEIHYNRGLPDRVFTEKFLELRE